MTATSINATGDTLATRDQGLDSPSREDRQPSNLAKDRQETAPKPPGGNAAAPAGSYLDVVTSRVCYTLFVPKDTGPDSLASAFEKAVSARDEDGAPGAITLAILPDRALGLMEKKAVAKRAEHLNWIYGQTNPYSGVVPWSLLWPAPAKGLTPAQEEERQALNAALIATAFPSPTVAAAKLQAQTGNPIGTSLSEVFGFIADRLPGGEPYKDGAKTTGF